MSGVRTTIQPRGWLLEVACFFLELCEYRGFMVIQRYVGRGSGQ